MPSFNQVILVGNLVRDPETRFLSSGAQLTKFGIGCNRRYTSNGEQRDEAMFIDCTAFGRLAEITAEYLHKGAPVLISGRLRLEQWQADDGSKRSKHSVVVDTVQFLGRRGETETAGMPATDAGNDDIPF